MNSFGLLRRLRSAIIYALLVVLAQAHGNAVIAQNQKDQTQDAAYFTLEVALPNAAPAKKFLIESGAMAKLPVLGAADLPGPGKLAVIYIGPFDTAAAARNCAERLVSLNIIKAFTVSRASNLGAVNRPRTIRRPKAIAPNNNSAFVDPEEIQANELPGSNRAAFQAAAALFNLLPPADLSQIPRPDPARLALAEIAGSNPVQKGGLWLSGDISEGLARLRWMMGSEHFELLKIDWLGQVKLDADMLTKAAGVTNPDDRYARLAVYNFISANEGLLLLAQVTDGPHRYLLHIGKYAPTLERKVAVESAINFDNNFDSRINPRRPDRKKVGTERPPKGFDSLVAINPVTRWFNFRSKKLVPSGGITFHELAEAHAKVAMGLDYEPMGEMPGAHKIAVEREQRLKWQQPFLGMVITSGLNRILRSEDEMRKFK